jgi:hypothetical protein
VRVLDGEDLASHTAPESCVAFREGRDEALTGDCAGQPLSGVKQLRDADAFRPAEGNTAHDDIARHAPIPRRRSPWHAQTPEVGFAHSSGEASERSGASRRGGGGAKGGAVSNDRPYRDPLTQHPSLCDDAVLKSSI